MRIILANPYCYNMFLRLMGAPSFRKNFVKEYIRPDDIAILDIGCGTGDILRYLPDYCRYTGFDASERYIDMAKAFFKGRGEFCCGMVGKHYGETNPEFDVVLALGVLHHLDDAQSSSLFQTAYQALRPGGRLVTLDGCFTENQSFVVKFLLKMDRGRFVRDDVAYIDMAKEHFSLVNTKVVHRKRRMPYTHIVMECVKE